MLCHGHPRHQASGVWQAPAACPCAYSFTVAMMMMVAVVVAVSEWASTPRLGRLPYLTTVPILDPSDGQDKSLQYRSHPLS